MWMSLMGPEKVESTWTTRKPKVVNVIRNNAMR